MYATHIPLILSAVTPAVMARALLETPSSSDFKMSPLHKPVWAKEHQLNLVLQHKSWYKSLDVLQKHICQKAGAQYAANILMVCSTLVCDRGRQPECLTVHAKNNWNAWSRHTNWFVDCSWQYITWCWLLCKDYVPNIPGPCTDNFDIFVGQQELLLPVISI